MHGLVLGLLIAAETDISSKCESVYVSKRNKTHLTSAGFEGMTPS